MKHSKIVFLLLSQLAFALNCKEKDASNQTTQAPSLPKAPGLPKAGDASPQAGAAPAVIANSNLEPKPNNTNAAGLPPQQAAKAEPATGDEDSDDASPEAATKTPTSFTVGGSISQDQAVSLKGSGLKLKLTNLVTGNTQTLTIAKGSTAFKFDGITFKNGEVFETTIVSQPTNITQTCSLIDGFGKIVGANVQSISIECAEVANPVKVDVSGLPSNTQLKFMLNNSSSLQVKNGRFPFSAPVASGSAYQVSLVEIPQSVNCSFTEASSGTMQDSEVVIHVACEPKESRKVKVSVTGLPTSSSLAVSLNNATSQSLSSNVVGQEIASLFSGSAYSIAITEQPKSGLCNIANPQGTIGDSDITIPIQCQAGQNITVQVSGLHTIGTSELVAVQFTLTGPAGITDTLTITEQADSTAMLSQTFAQKIPTGLAYNVIVSEHPTGGICQLTSNNAQGNMSAEEKTISFTCKVGTPHKVKVNVTGLSTYVSANRLLQKPFLSLTTSGSASQSQILEISNDTPSDTPIEFAIAASTGDNYNVSLAVAPILSSPTATSPASSISCLLQDSDQATVDATSASGSFNASNPSLDDDDLVLTLNCTPTLFTLKVATTGLQTGKSVTLQLKTGINEANKADLETLTISGNETLSFTNKIASGNYYEIQNLTNIEGLTCSLSNNSGTMLSNEVTASLTCTNLTLTINVANLPLGTNLQLLLTDPNGTESLIQMTASSKVLSASSNSSYTLSFLNNNHQPIGSTNTICSFVGEGGSLNTSTHSKVISIGTQAVSVNISCITN